MMACSCSNPSCMVNGCAIQRNLQQQYAPNADPHRIGQTIPSSTITADDVRRIVREEIERAKG